MMVMKKHILMAVGILVAILIIGAVTFLVLQRYFANPASNPSEPSGPPPVFQGPVGDPFIVGPKEPPPEPVLRK